MIKFPNAPCTTELGVMGTCYSKEECKERRGQIDGSCADGYGVCCIFERSCGDVAKENMTYFISPDVTHSKVCQLRVKQIDKEICQLRLDFESFIIAGPSTNSDVSFDKPIVGQYSVTDSNRCLMDFFSMSNPGGGAPPVLCGLNSGEHMYVDSSVAGNDLTFQLSHDESIQRIWRIKISQYSGDFVNLAPPGCTQYFFGSIVGTVKTFNFDGGIHLDNQNQNICVRQERGFCRICWTTQTPDDFAVSGLTKAGGITVSVSIFYAFV